MQRLKLCFYLDIRTGLLYNGHDECEVSPGGDWEGYSTLKVREEHFGVYFLYTDQI